MLGSRFVVACSLMALLAGCAVESESADTDTTIPRGLQLDESSESRVAGTFADDAHALRFSAELSGDDFALEVELHGMTIAVAKVGEDVEYEAYATDNGKPTQLTDDDRAALLALGRELESLGEVEPPLARLRSFANQWAEFPSTLEPSGRVYLGFRAYSSLCWAKNTYQTVTHDCWSYNDGADGSTYSAYIGMQAPAAGCAEDTYFWVGSSWSCLASEPNHSTSIEYAYGGCFGRCGAGCGSDSQLTVDCANHDSCVRFGHDIASLWCDDEFTSTIDDWASAPNCGA